MPVANRKAVRKEVNKDLTEYFEEVEGNEGPEVLKGTSVEERIKDFYRYQNEKDDGHGE